MSAICFDIARRESAVEYRYGDPAAPLEANGHVYECTTAGVSGPSEPSFNTGSGSTTADGTVVWTERNPSGIMFNEPIVFGHNPRYGEYRRKRKYAQPVSYSEGGDVYVYDKGSSARNTREITFSVMLSTDLKNLLDFIEIVRGAKFAFNFHDEEGTVHKTIILNPDEITSAPVSYGFEGDITLELYLL
ncbi:MAG TPA: hypothetical protein PLR60_05660 [Syntrophorhabdaceae bacterium]|nr:hypothetical protein [Syntrophorhabdaceae bacterium]